MSLTPQEALLVLNLIPGIGSMRTRALLDYFGSAELALEAPVSMLECVPRIGRKIASSITQWQSCTNLSQELEAAERHGVRIISFLDEEYPPNLRHMQDAPIILYVKGAWIGKKLDRAVSIVGSRNCSAYGMQAAQQLARELADAGCSVISGLALGIDAAAHRGALDAGGHTIGVLGSGHGCFFPEKNIDLAIRMLESGGSVVSEYPIYMRPSHTSFPQRNRIVAAWSQATVVVEAPERSGALHTARLAADEYGRDVFAVPGSIYGTYSRGSHDLIRDGAILCAHSQHLLSDMGWLNSHQQQEIFQHDLQAKIATEKRPVSKSSELEPCSRAIYEAIAAGNSNLDQLCSATGMGAHELTPQLMRLQISGHIIALAGAQFSIKK